MSDGYRNGAFALGIVVGGGIVVNLFLWLSYVARQETHQGGEPQNNDQGDQIQPYWEGIVGTFVSPSDTLAQWIMAIFTCGATIVLVLTLKAANRTNKSAIAAAKAANETNRIMRSEQRPWIEILVNEIDIDNFSEPLARPFSFKVKNHGHSPAHDVFASFQFFAGERDRLRERAESLEAALRQAVENLPGQMAYPDSPLDVTIVQPPDDMMAIGSGEKWNVLLVCLYSWGEENFLTWIAVPAPKPLEARIRETQDELRRVDEKNNES